MVHDVEYARQWLRDRLKRNFSSTNQFGKCIKDITFYEWASEKLEEELKDDQKVFALTVRISETRR